MRCPAMTAMPAPIAQALASVRALGPAVPVLLALAFSADEAAALLHEIDGEDACAERPGAVCRALAERWRDTPPACALIEGRLRARHGAALRRVSRWSIADLALRWPQRAPEDGAAAAAMIWRALQVGGVAGRRLAEAMADDVVYARLRG